DRGGLSKGEGRAVEAAAVVLRHASIGRRPDECAACPAGGLSWLTLQLTAGAQRDLNESDCQFNRRSGCNSSASPLYARPFHTRALVSGREKIRRRPPVAHGVPERRCPWRPTGKEKQWLCQISP